MGGALPPDDQAIGTGYWAALIAPLGPLVIWVCGVDDYPGVSSRMTAWFILLGLTLTCLDYSIRRETLARQVRGPRRTWPQSAAAGVWRWLAWSFLIGLGAALYGAIPLYSEGWYLPFRGFLTGRLLPGWLALGLPYAVVTMRLRPGLRWDRKDPAVLVLLLGRGLPWGRWGAILRHCFRPRSARVVWAGLAVKFFFLPIMFKFFLDSGFHVVKDAGALAAQLQGSLAFRPGTMGTAEAAYFLLFDAVIFIDVSLASLGYLVTTRWIDAGMRSVDLNPLAWAACLACYMPFNGMVARHMGLPTADVTAIGDPALRAAAMAGVLACMAVYMWSTLAFGLRFSNLTHRGLFSRGPYAFVRHPAYAAKNLSWWIEAGPNLGDPRALLCLLGWNAVYWLRAVTEERHLSRDPRYAAYADRVPCRFFPGLRRRAEGP